MLKFKVILASLLFFLLPTSVHAATTYYVATTGNDSNSGTLASPWKTIQKGVNALSPGDTLYVRGGSYTEKIAINNSGTASSPITISGYPSESVIMDGNGLDPNLPKYTSLVILYGSYIVFENFELTYPNGRGVYIAKASNTGQNATHNIIRNLNIHNMWSAGIGVWGDYNLIENNKVWQTVLSNKCDRSVPDNTCLTQSWSAPLFFGDSSNPYYGLNTIIRNNEVYQNYGEGILCMYTDNAIIEGNRVWDNWAEDIYLDQCSFTTIKNNLSYYTNDHEFWRSSSQPASGIDFANEGLIKNPSHPIGHDLTIFNNIVINAGSGIGFWTGFASGGALINDVITNNTVVSNVPNAYGIYIDTPNAANHQNSVIENNLILVNNGNPGFSQSITGLTFTHNLWSKTPNSSVTGTGDIIADPKLVDPTHILDLDQINHPVDANWYKLTSMSPAINKAVSLPEVTTDYFGSSRGSSPDMGAVEYASSLPGDINHDGVVNIQDYTLLSNAFGTNNTSADINSDGVVNIQDYTILSNNFGKTS